MSDQPTMEEVLKVRRAECRANGHSWAHVHIAENELPHLIVCDRCGRSARVIDDE